MGLLGTKTFLGPHFFHYRKLASFGLHTIPEFQWAGSKQVLIRVGRRCEAWEEQSREAIV